MFWYKFVYLNIQKDKQIVHKSTQKRIKVDNQLKLIRYKQQESAAEDQCGVMH